MTEKSEEPKTPQTLKPIFYLRKNEHSTEYWMGYTHGRSAISMLLNNHSGWLTDTFGKEPSSEKRAAIMALTHALSLIEFPHSALIAAWIEAQAEGRVVERDF